MARRAFAASFVLGSLALVVGQTATTQGCTQDFSTFDASGGGDSAPTSSVVSSSSTGPGPSSSGQSTTTTGPGGGDGGGDGGGPTTSTGDGGSGGAGGGTGGGTGGAPACETPEQCNDDNLCTTDTCDAGTCSNIELADGTIEPGYVDVPTDCVTRECSAGVGAEVADLDDDPPEDAVACRERVCNGTNVADGDPIREGLSCGPDPQVCVAGVCTGCDDAADCPTPAGACEVATCVASACGSDFTDVDPVDGNTADCRTPTCDGAAPNILFVADSAQTPPNVACGIGMCNGMTPELDPVGEGTDCAVGSGVCDGDGDDATCVQCVDDSAAGSDSGCSGQTQQCDDSGTPVCVRCIPGGATPELGCNPGALICNPDGNAGEGECVDCFNSGGEAIGCADPDTDECNEAAGAGQCFNVCFNVDPGADPGCATASLPNCNEGGQVCQECTAPGDCAANINGNLCNQTTNTECGCSGAIDALSCLIGGVGSSQGTQCVSGACGCSGTTDCDHLGSAGPVCNVSGVCVPL